MKQPLQMDKEAELRRDQQIQNLISRGEVSMNLKEECTELVRKLMVKHKCLQPENQDFDIWDANDAKEIVADLVQGIKESYEIDLAHTKKDWGK